MERTKPSVTGLGNFLKLFGTKFIAKVGKIFNNNFGLLWKIALFTLNWCMYFLSIFWTKLGHFLLQHLVTLNKKDFEWGERGNNGSFGRMQSGQERERGKLRKERERSGSSLNELDLGTYVPFRSSWQLHLGLRTVSAFMFISTVLMYILYEVCMCPKWAYVNKYVV